MLFQFNVIVKLEFEFDTFQIKVVWEKLIKFNFFKSN